MIANCVENDTEIPFPGATLMAHNGALCRIKPDSTNLDLVYAAKHLVSKTGTEGDHVYLEQFFLKDGVVQFYLGS